MFLQWFAAYHVFKVLYIETLDRFNVQAYRLPTERYASQLPQDTRFETLWAVEHKNFEALYNLTRQAHVPLVIIDHSPIKEDKKNTSRSSYVAFVLSTLFHCSNIFAAQPTQPIMYRATPIIQHCFIKNWSRNFLTNNLINGS